MGRTDRSSGDEGFNLGQQFSLSRRSMLRGGLGTAGLGLISAKGMQASAAATTWTLSAPRRAPALAQATGGFSIYPLPDTRTASPQTEITFRGVTVDDLGFVTVTGNQSGAHAGILKPHADGNGVSFVPDAPFRAGEQVTVSADIPLGAADDGAHVFRCVRPLSPPPIATTRPTQDQQGNPITPTEPTTYVSRPDLEIPAINVTDPPNGAAEGYVFVAPRTPDKQSGPMIVDNSGQPIWFLPLEREVELAGDVKVQEYDGKPVLTWWQGVLFGGHGFGHMEIRDTAYQLVKQVRVANGYSGIDIHDFIITPQGTALFPVYNIVRWDMTPVDGPEKGIVTDSIIQEVEIETGRVLLEWHSLDHVGLDEATIPLPEDPEQSWDYYHLNSIALDDDDNFIVSARNTSAIYSIDRKSGEVLWRLSGKNSSFEGDQAAEIAFQHDARPHSGGLLSLFNNATSNPDAGIISRGVVLELDTDAMTASVVQEYQHPSEIVSVSQGNMQVLPNGNTFVGWGSAPVFSEFAEDGKLRFNGRFDRGVQTYRAYRFPWVGEPSEAPAIAAQASSDDLFLVYASWNGATDVATWRVLAGPSPDDLSEVTTTSRLGFETAMNAVTSETYIAVEALDSAGNSLGVSEAIEAPR